MYISDQAILSKFHHAGGPNMHQNNVWRDFRLPMSTFGTVERKIFNGKCCKN